MIKQLSTHIFLIDWLIDYAIGNCSARFCPRQELPMRVCLGVPVRFRITPAGEAATNPNPKEGPRNSDTGMRTPPWDDVQRMSSEHDEENAQQRTDANRSKSAHEAIVLRGLWWPWESVCPCEQWQSRCKGAQWSIEHTHILTHTHTYIYSGGKPKKYAYLWHAVPF